MDALARLFDGEFTFKVNDNRQGLDVYLRGERIMYVPTRGETIWPGDQVNLTLGTRTYQFRAPRWSLTLRESA